MILAHVIALHKYFLHFDLFDKHLAENKLIRPQNGINYATHMLEAGEIISVQSQVSRGPSGVLISFASLITSNASFRR